MAAPKRTRGFTLVELLVVITIIGMLVSLLLPAIQSAREAGRRNTCSSNMRNVGLALQQFESSKKYYPGYSNFIALQTSSGLSYTRVSWVVPILPYLERNDLYQSWQNPNATPTQAILAGAAGGQFISQLNILLCPSNSNPNLGTNPLNFVVNTGRAVTASDTNLLNAMKPIPTGWTYVTEDVSSGVFFNHCNWDGNLNGASGSVTPSIGSKVNADYISTNDGTTYTLMLSENLQAYSWATDPTDQNPSPQIPFSSDAAARQGTGMVWFITTNVNNDGPPQLAVSSSNFYVASMGINDSAKQLASSPAAATGTASGTGANPFPAAYNQMTALTQVSGLAYSRPSSNHPGGVNAMFVGGNMRFLAEDIPYRTFTQLMTSNQNAVNTTPLSGTATTVRSAGWTYLLNEADF